MESLWIHIIQRLVWNTIFCQLHILVKRSFIPHIIPKTKGPEESLCAPSTSRHTHRSINHPLAFSVLLNSFLSLDSEIGRLSWCCYSLESPFIKDILRTSKRPVTVRIRIMKAELENLESLQNTQSHETYMGPKPELFLVCVIVFGS